MRYLQVNKFSYLLLKLFKVKRDDLLANDLNYDKFLQATICECLLSFIFLIFSISFLNSILTFIQNTPQVISSLKHDDSFQYIYNIFNDSRPDYSSLKNLYSHSRNDPILSVKAFYSNHKLDKINCSQLDSKAAKCMANCCIILVLKNDYKTDQILNANQLEISTLANGKKSHTSLFYLNKDLKFISNFQVIHDFGPNDVVFTKLKLNCINTNNLNYNLNLFCFICTVAFSFYFLVNEIFKIYAYRLDYFCIVLNLADLILVGLSFSFIIIHIVILTCVSSFQNSQLNLYKMYSQMSNLIEYQSKQLNLTIIILVFSWFKLYRFINFTVGITQMNATLSLAFPELLSYLVAFLLLLSGFSVLLNRLFGAISSDLNSFFKSQFSLFKFLIGHADFKLLFEYNSKTARLIFFSYFLFVFIIFLNIFLAIINSSYSYVLRSYANKCELDYYEFFKQRFTYLIDTFRRRENLSEKAESNIEVPQSPRVNTIDSNEITDSISASKFRTYLLNTIKRVENADIDVIYQMNNIREKGLKRFTEAFEKIYGDLDKELELDSELETILTPDQCKEIIIKLNLAKKRISFIKNSQYLRKKSFFKPVFYQKNTNDEINDDENVCLSAFSSMSSLRSKSSANSNETNEKNDNKSDQMLNSDINHELSFKEFDNIHTELVSWKEFVTLKKSLMHLQNEINFISNNFINELK